MTTETTTRIAYRGVTRAQAEYLMMAPVAAGGWIARDGVHVRRISPQDYEIMGPYPEDSDPWHPVRDAEGQVTGYVAAEGWEIMHADDMVMMIPADHPIAQTGYPLPPALIEEIRERMERRGYDVPTPTAPEEDR